MEQKNLKIHEIPLAEVLRTTPKHLKFLGSVGISTLEHFLLVFPREYENRTEITHISDLRADEKNVMFGKLFSVHREKTKTGISLVKGIFEDENSGALLECVWFQNGIERMLPQSHKRVMLVGKAKMAFGKISFQNPSVEVVEKETLSGGITALYSDKGFLSGAWFFRKMQEDVLPFCKKNAVAFPSVLPEKILEEEHLLIRKEAFFQIHNPENLESLEKAKKTFSFEELFVLQCVGMERKKMFQTSGKIPSPTFSLDADFVKNFFATLPFSLTNGQKIALFEILKDFEKSVPMQRMMEGDVGSGKTIVALISALCVVKNGFQVAILAPTEILARQHEISFQKFLSNAEEKGFFSENFSSLPSKNHSVFQAPILSAAPNVAFLSGSVTGKKRAQILEEMKTGKIDILVGTHAILEDAVVFKNLGLAVVDEQHRFGVLQREKLLQKGNPHFLQMSATPIPRSLALVAFGDQDISVIAELPAGRKKIETRVVKKQDRRTVEFFVDDQIAKGRQIFVICPLVEDSEHILAKSATEEFLRLEEHIFPNRKIALLHGRMHPHEKDEIMADFKAKKFDILVSTSVVEVGVDVPNATIMIIEGAERFGLSQLHQFRGRVGRGEHQSYCFLFSTNDKDNTRLKAMEKTENGFDLAEIDMNLRGPGEVFGLRQSGIPDMKMANLMDGRTIAAARKKAEEFFEMQDLKNFPLLWKLVEERKNMG